MPPQFFVKFQYKDKIKKIGLTETDLTWDYICQILYQAFSLPKDRLKLTYKDQEGDEITACCDEDIIEAYKARSSLESMRFFVYLCSNVRSSHGKSLSVGKDMSASSQQVKLEESKEKTCEVLKSKSMSVPSEKVSMVDKEKFVSDGAIKEENLQVEEQIDISSQEIGKVLEEILLTKEAKQKILELRKSAENQDRSYRYKIHAEQAQIADSVLRIFNEVLNETVVLDINEKANNVNSIVSSVEEDPKKILRSEDWKSLMEEKTRNHQNNQSISEGNIFNKSLKESIYEKSTLPSIKEAKIEDFKEKSLSDTTMSFCRDLSSTYGVKLALKFENGKMKLISVPSQEYSIIDPVESQPKEKSEIESISKKNASVKEPSNSHDDCTEYYKLLLAD